MKRILEEGQLTTDMECAYKALRNIGRFDPIPDPLIGSDDPRLSDERLMLSGSVTNPSVANDAGIQQAKLNLNGDLPLSWLLSAADEVVTVGTVPGPDEPVTSEGKNVTVGLRDMSLYAVPGDDAEFLIHKAQANGYVPLDGSGRMPIAHYPVGANLGTVSFFQLNSFASFLLPVPDRVSAGAVTMATNWFLVAPGVWFGNVLGETRAPTFDNAPFYPSMVPNLDASRIPTGTFPHQRLPVARGVGPSHAPGIVPDPGLNTPLAADYLARDMTFKTMTDDIPYQTRVPDPSISYVPTGGGNVLVTITSPLPSTSLFYFLEDGSETFHPYTGSFTIGRPVTIEAYGAKVGYNNSHRVLLIIPP